MSYKKIESLAYRLKDYESLRALFAELNFEFSDEPVNKEHWNQDQIKMVQEAKIIAIKDDYRIYYIQTNTDSLTQWKGIATKIIKENNGLCLICSHNPSGFKWVFSSLSKDFSKSFTETRHVPIDIRPDIGVPQTFVEFLEKIKINKDSTASSIASQISGAFDSFAVTIHDELTVNVFEALKSLSEGIVLEKSNDLTLDKNTLEEIREPIFILLYRLIFILYAEDRGIFPIDHKIYYEKFSLKWLKQEWLLKSENQKNLSEYQVQDRIWDFFRLIELGSEDLGYDSNEFFMRSYYGRIFDRNINQKLNKWKIKNQYLLDAISLLTRTRDKNGNYFFLDYSALETRHLGSIYERLLEFHLTTKDNKISDLPNPQERKTSGSYYTPQFIVDYMIENTLEPIIDKIKKNNNDKFVQIEKILSLNILDPAMGSGHFLIGVVNHLAKRICEIEYGEITEQRLNERKRDVARRCVYGVDINPLAVDLAMVSLWLETLSSDKPLSFLSAHLKCGNSLLGSQINILFNKQTTLMESQKGREKFKKTIKDFLMFENLDDDSTSAVKTKIERYQKIQSKGTIYYDIKSLLDCKVAESFGLKVPMISDFKTKIGENSLDFFTDTLWQKIQQLTLQYRIFHWDLEFPDMFYDEQGIIKKNNGFDVIIGNPPYVRQEKLLELKDSLKLNYTIFAGTADLYTYFYEKGLNLLKEDGLLTYISSNKFMRAKYGVYLRTFLKHNTTIKRMIDLGGAHVFDAITNTVIMMMTKGFSKNNKVLFGNDILGQVSTIEQDSLDDSAWTLAEPNILELKTKIEKNGVPLKSWNVEINYGLKTAFNEAYVIDTETKENLCKKDPKNTEIIKQIIRGRDIGRYFHRWNGLWIINTHNGYKTHNSQTKNIPPINVKRDYPTIYKFLSEINNRTNGKIEKREDQGDHWTNLRNCAFLDDFKKEKIIWIELTDKNRFSYSPKEEYLLAGAFLMTGESLKYLLSFLNSKLCGFYFKLICNSSGMATIQWKKFALEKIPIPKLDEDQQKPFEKLVDEILSITKDNDYQKNTEKQNKVKKLENDIDKLIYNVYRLTDEEVKIVES